MCKLTASDPLAQAVEHLTFNQGVRGSIPRWVTNKQKTCSWAGFLFVIDSEVGRSPQYAKCNFCILHCVRFAKLSHLHTLCRTQGF